MTTAPSRLWIIRHPESQGAIVAKFDTAGETQIPDVVADYDDFVIQSVSNRSALRDHEIDHSGLSEQDKEVLSMVYPVEQS